MFADYWELQNLGVDKFISVTTVWHILAANILNKQSGTEVKGSHTDKVMGEELTAGSL